MDYTLALSRWRYRTSIVASEIPIDIVNSYMVVEVVGDVIYLVVPYITPCRDTFLFAVDTLLRLGTDSSLTIALFVPKDSSCGDLNLEEDYTSLYEKGWKPLVVDKVSIGDVTLGVVLFTITPETYRTPAYFWMLTQDIRMRVTGFSKIVPHAPEYHSLNYRNIARVLSGGDAPGLVVQPVVSANFYEPFFNFNSPLGIVTGVDMVKTLILESTIGGSSAELKRITTQTLRKYSEAFFNFYPGIRISLYQATRAVDIGEIFSYYKKLSEETKP